MRLGDRPFISVSSDCGLSYFALMTVLLSLISLSLSLSLSELEGATTAA